MFGYEKGLGGEELTYSVVLGVFCRCQMTGDDFEDFDR